MPRIETRLKQARFHWTRLWTSSEYIRSAFLQTFKVASTVTLTVKNQAEYNYIEGEYCAYSSIDFNFESNLVFYKLLYLDMY